MRYFVLILLTTFSNFIIAQQTTPIFPDLTGDDLLDELKNHYTTSTVLSYGDARDLLYGTIDLRNDSVECIYSGHKVYLAPGEDPSTFIFKDGDKNGINAEHVFPRSKGADFGNPLADMHHIFPCRVEVNTNRGSFPFAEIDDQDTESWYRLDTELSTIPNSNIDSYSEGVRGVEGFFEPRESRKGDIARAMFYFYTIYQARADAEDANFFSQQMATLCQWHEADPVDEMEYSRTFKIAEYQDAIPNPFILDCSLVQRAYCQSQEIDCPELPIISSTNTTITHEYNYYPNPFSDEITIESEGVSRVSIADIRGITIIEESFIDAIDLDTSLVPPGIYFLRINERVYKLIK